MRLMWSQESRHLPEPTAAGAVYVAPSALQPPFSSGRLNCRRARTARAFFMETGKSGVSKESLPSDSITAAGVSEHLSTCKGAISKTE